MQNNNTAVQEILLLHNTRFLLRNWLSQKDAFVEKYTAAKDQLKEACWNGLVPEILPECFEANLREEGYLWDINDARSFIGLNYCQSYPVKENRFSLYPHIFMPVQDYN